MAEVKTSSEDTNRSRLDIGLPGCGLPLNHIVKALFRNALSPTSWDALLPLITLRERTMLSLMDQLSNKPDWDKKVFDETIASKWKAEALEASATGVDITQRMVDWCIEELRYKAKILERSGGAISVYPGDVVKSDTIVPKSLHNALRVAAAPLESVPDLLKDWHPGSDGKVLDLVHPSLFPLIYGRTRVLTEGLTALDSFIDLCGSGHTLEVPPASETSVFTPYGRVTGSGEFSNKFQWLPCEVDISEEHARITSYINNLNPEQHKDLYQVIEQFISRAIPMWNMTLTPLKNRGYRYSRIIYTACEYDPDPDSLPDTEGPQMEEDEDEDDYWDRRQEWIEDTRRVILPEPDEFQPPSVPEGLQDEYLDPETRELKPEKAVNLRRDFRHQGLQVIVKLANIHLTPDKPDYAGGTWHVEGQLNEHICATALYYYDSVNISTSLLAFRQQCDNEEAMDISYEQNAHDWLDAVFGVRQEGPAVQEIGAIETKEGRLITFPNVLQHRVQPFSLEDPSRPGHRKILALFLVDPNIRIISTANVPCQRQDWWREKVCEGGPHALANLPLELQDQVYEQVEEFPISMEEAKKLRLELMDERRAYVTLHSNAVKSNIFSLCEH